MGIFFKIFETITRHKAHPHLGHLYSQLNHLASALATLMSELRKEQREIIQELKQQHHKGATHELGLSKTRAIESQLIPKLISLAKHSEKSFVEAIQHEPTGPASEIARIELTRTVHFLERLETALERVQQNTPNNEDRLILVEETLRTISDLCDEYHEIEKYEEQVKKGLQETNLTPPLLKVFNNAKMREVTDTLGHKTNILVYDVSKKELKRLWRESEKVNAARDKNTNVVWRTGWADEPMPEIDKGTGLHERHVNVSLKLRGDKRKVHLLLH